MRIRTFAAASAVALAAALPLAGTAFAADKNCDDFATKAEAVAAAQNGDPYNLDDDNDGNPCETRFGSGGSTSSSGSTSGADQVTAKPVGGVETGGGPESALSGGLAVALGAAAAGGVGAVAARRFARR